jgi:cysteine desulfuration protein SufE
MTIQESMSELATLFAIFDNPKDKFVQLMDMARESASLTENEQTEQNKIYGCTSQAWVVAEARVDGTYQFRTDSDALIVKGLLNILERIFNGHSSTEIRSVNGNRVLDSVGLGGSISSQRTNGFASAIQKIKEIAV